MDTTPALPTRLTKSLLICGILAALIFGGTDIIAGSLTLNYRFDTQSVSVLSSSGTATRSYVLTFNLCAIALQIAFSIGIWFSSGKNWIMRVVAVLLAVNAILTVVAIIFFPLHAGEAMNSPANSVNVIFMAISVTAFFLAVIIGVFANRNWFRYFSIGLLVIFFIADVLATMGLKPALGGHPGPLVGVQERTMIYGELVWMALQAVVLLRS